jgi:hypothetical protein
LLFGVLGRGFGYLDRFAFRELVLRDLGRGTELQFKRRLAVLRDPDHLRDRIEPVSVEDVSHACAALVGRSLFSPAGFRIPF